MTGSPAEHTPTSPAIKAITLAGLWLALGGAIGLTGSALNWTSLPGCGVGSPCQRAASSPWGSIPGLGLPVAILGLAYFIACLIGCTLIGPARMPAIARWIIRAGAAVSVLYTGVMVIGGMLCWVCLLVHVGNLAFTVGVHLSSRTRLAAGAGVRRSLFISGGIGLTSLILLSLAWLTATRAVQQRSRDALDASTRQIAAAPSTISGFRGRYLFGPEVAAIRIVLFSDYQCQECRRIDAEALRLAAAHPSIQLSIKHFPLCADCNRAATKTIHANACLAAIAAEAAGAAGGFQAFWNATGWLFDHAGTFTNEELLAASTRWQVDPAKFRAALSDPGILELIRKDVDEGLALGVSRTPAIYINGIELRGWEAPAALDQAIQMLLPLAQPQASDADRPADAQTKAIEDWRSGPVINIPTRAAAQSPSSQEPPVRLVIFGDYQDEFSAEADAIARRYTQTWPGTIYEFRHFPASTACNPRLPQNIHPLACRMARAAEAASLLGGPPALARMHEWLFEHRRDFSDAGLRGLASELKLDPQILITALKDTRVEAIIQTDIQAGNAIGIAALPAIYINGKFVPVWKTPQGELLTRMLDLAAQPTGPPEPSPPRDPRPGK